ncbi:MAG: TrkA family potassium uptake protein [Chloroflexi bacterium]|nr:TrkA family potassium uptake protein [Chloroflexota bacterium]
MHIIIIGGGHTTYFLTRDLTAKNHRVTIINNDPGESRELARRTDALVVLGNGSDPDILAEAGARRADMLIALTDRDQDNLITCQMAVKLYGVPRTLSLVNDPDNIEVFRKLGVTTAFSAIQVITSMIEAYANFEDIVALMPVGEGELTISEVRLSKKSPSIGKRIMDLGLSQGTLIAAIIRNGKAVVPSGQSILLIEDVLVLVTEHNKAEADLNKLTGSDV